jgi:hypothetical protein
MVGWRVKTDVIEMRKRFARWLRFSYAGWKPALPGEFLPGRAVEKLGEDGGGLSANLGGRIFQDVCQGAEALGVCWSFCGGGALFQGGGHFV